MNNPKWYQVHDNYGNIYDLLDYDLIELEDRLIFEKVEYEYYKYFVIPKSNVSHIRAGLPSKDIMKREFNNLYGKTVKECEDSGSK